MVLAPTMLLAGGSVSGRVTAKGEGEPIVGVNVLLQGTVRGTTTNTRGEYRLADVPAGTKTLIFSMVGYERVTRSDVVVEDGKETVLNVEMTQTPVQTEQIVVTANKRPQSLEEVPISISLLDSRDIQRRNSQTLDDALRYIPGVNITGFQVNIRGSSGYSRGAGSRVLMLLDGVPFITGDTGELNFESIPIGQVERIEVVKGASSALYGSNALGGVINVITKSIPETPETRIRTYGGLYSPPAFNEWKWSDKARTFNGESISHALKVGNLGVSLFLSRQFDDGYRLNDYRRRYNFYLKTQEDFSASSSLTLNFGLLYQFGGQFLYWRNLDSALIPPILQQNDNVKSIRYYTSGVYNAVLSDNILFTSKTIWYHNDWGYETIHQIGRSESLSDDVNTEAMATFLISKVHTVTAGINGTLDMVTADLFGKHLGGSGALYGQDEMKFSNLITVTLGARIDYQSRGLTTASGQVNPKAAVAFMPAEGTTLRASVGRGFRVPSVAEAFISAEVSNLATLPNRDLHPERSTSYEVGLSQSVSGVGTIDIAGFRTDFTDMIEPGLIVSGTNLPYIQWRNVTDARVQGFETSLSLGAFDGALSWNLGYTYVYPEDRTLHDILKYRPRHLLYTNFLARVGWLSAGADFRYVSRVDRIDVELVNLGIVQDGDERTDIRVADFRIGADFVFGGVPLTATLNVNNAFRYNYVELIGNIMPPRTYVLSLEARM
jgi:iron complex outermembrane receptor protein